jgi:hypothetical protein
LKTFQKVSFVIAALTLSFVSVPQSKAQTASNAAAVTVEFDLESTLTVAASPGDITFASTDARHATSSGPISVVTSWNLTAGGVNITTAAYFASAAAALSDGVLNIPASDVFASIGGGTATACTATNTNVPAATAGATCPAVFVGTDVEAQGTDTHTLRLSLTSPTDIPASAGYAGTITISAQTT